MIRGVCGPLCSRSAQRDDSDRSSCPSLQLARVPKPISCRPVAGSNPPQVPSPRKVWIQVCSISVRSDAPVAREAAESFAFIAQFGFLRPADGSAPVEETIKRFRGNVISLEYSDKRLNFPHTLRAISLWSTLGVMASHLCSETPIWHPHLLHTHMRS